MNLKDLTINVLPLLILISLIIVAVRPQSNVVEIDRESIRSSPKMKVIRVENKTKLTEDPDIDSEKVSKK